jgi:IS1 family transposase/transposase-like protein
MLQATLAFLAVVLLVLIFFDGLRTLLLPTEPTPLASKEAPLREPRPLRPRTPEDCPDCRAATVPPNPSPVGVSSARAWREVKSRRGRPKRVNTEGFACPNPDCAYRGVSDSQVHALVGYGHHGQSEPIQDLFCQACRHKFTVRRHTPLYRLRTSPARVALVLTALAEGLSVAGAVHTFDHAEATITRWLRRAGGHAERMHRRFFCNLRLLQVQLDELRTTLRHRGHEVWVWLALDAKSKVIAAVQFGPRTQPLAHALVHALVQTLAPECLPLFTSDGLDFYGYALTAHFGEWVQAAGQKKRQWQVKAELLYGQLKKTYRRRRLVKTERRIRWGALEAFRAKLQEQELSRVLNTAFVERVNLTIRRGIAALQRRSWSTTQTQHALEMHFQWWRAYYHFIRPHRSLREPLEDRRARSGRREPQRHGNRTPAMVVGATDHRWSVVELLSFPVAA